jgi:Uma2 family endonuclease
MVAHRKREYVTRPEYLAGERKATTKSEYHDGVVVAMAGASWEHNLIVGNIQRNLGNQLEQTPCVPVTNDMRLRVEECNRDFYPDVIVVCGRPVFEDEALDTLTNPTLIVEVLSNSTEKADRRLKWNCYRTLPSLQTYVLVAQDAPHIEMFTRHDDDSWGYEAVSGQEAVVPLPAIGCTLRLSEVYARVEFAPVLDADTL